MLVEHPDNEVTFSQCAAVFRSPNALVPGASNKLHDSVIECVIFSPWTSSAMEAMKEMKFGTKR